MKPFFALFLLFLTACQHVAQPEGYRMNRYKAPVPATVVGGKTIDVQTARALWEKGVAFVDVIPSKKFLTQGIEQDWLVVKPHMSIVRGFWLPDVGRGALTPAQSEYFRTSLDEILKQDKTSPVVFFCRRSCWMSWNATKRAGELGFKQIYWFSDGIDGWEEAGHELADVVPYGAFSLP